MKKIVEYQCEICFKRYGNKHVALECENRGVFNDQYIKPGFVFAHEPANSQREYIYAVVSVEIDANPHFGNIGTAAYRNNQYGDNGIGEGTCGFYYLRGTINDLEFNGFTMKDENFEQEEFHRCLADFTNHGIELTYLQNGKIYKYV